MVWGLQKKVEKMAEDCDWTPDQTESIQENNMNLLTNKQREQLAELAGGVKRMGRVYMTHAYYFDNGDEILTDSWLSGDLTSPESYYQVHLVLEGVRAKGFSFSFIENISGYNIYDDEYVVPILSLDLERLLFALTPHVICLAALELIGDGG